MKKRAGLRKMFMALAALGLTALALAAVYTGSIPEKYLLRPGDVSSYDIVATRSIRDKAETERRALRAWAEVAEITLRSEDVVLRVADRQEQLFALVRQERADPPLISPTPVPRDPEAGESGGQTGELETNEPLEPNISRPPLQLVDREKLAERIVLMVTRELNLTLQPDDAFFFARVSEDRLDRIENHTRSISRQIMSERVDEESLRHLIRQQVSDLQDELTYDREDALLVERLLTQTLEANVLFDAAATENARQAAYNRILNNPVMIEKGTRIVSIDDVITAQTYELLQELDLIDSGRFDTTHLVGILVLLLPVLLISGFYLNHYEKKAIATPRDLTALLLSVLIPLLFSVTTTRYAPLSPPVYFAAVLLASYFGFRAAMILTLGLSMLVLPMTAFNPMFLAVALSGSLVAALLAKGIMRKDHYAFIILATSGTNSLIAFAFSLMQKAGWSEIAINSGTAAASGALSVIAAIGMMPLFEMLFNVVSPMRLIELSQPGHPLLRRLFVEAPGTSQHSMMVANLADSAAVAIGADALLARVGAYYHDIGKLEEPVMFTENQEGANPHDQLPPEQSARIILNHAEAGMRIGRRYRLPKPVLDMVREHHGTTELIYFWRKAQDLAREQGLPEPDPDIYRYPGVLPSSRESAIVMLADSVEAAMKSTGTSSLDGAEHLIRRVIKTKNEQDQLVASGLSFEDVERMVAAFLQVYTGHFHERVKYPDDHRLPKPAV